MNNQAITNEVIFIDDAGNIQVNTDVIKTKPKLISLFKTIREYGIDINTLTSDETNELLACILIVSR